MNDAPVVRVRKVMPAPPDVVFDQWLDPESLKEWMCPRPTRVVAITLEPHVGGLLCFDIDDSGTAVRMNGRFLAIERPHRLSFTWSESRWRDPTTRSVVTVTFEQHGDDQTLMTIEHSLLPPEHFDEFRNGWVGVLDQLAAVLNMSS
jgi:uncharacterized protein YndB with AHSA1/START domain